MKNFVMKNFVMKNLLLFMSIAMLFTFIGCSTDADLASYNLSRAAEQFEIERRIIFYNGITDNYILSVEGRCSVEFHKLKFEVTCNNRHDNTAALASLVLVD